MNWSLELFLTILGASGVTATAITAALIWLSKSWISEKIKAQIKIEYDSRLEILRAKLKSEADVEIEKLRSQLNIAAAERQVRFSRLHERRADVIAEVYASLKLLVSTLANYVKPFEFGGEEPRSERGKKVADTGNMFLKLYGEKKIFIPKATTDKLDKISAELLKAHTEFRMLVDVDRNNQDLKKWMEIHETVGNLSKTALTELEDEFRRLLGDEAVN